MTDFDSIPFLAGGDWLLDQEKTDRPRCYFCHRRVAGDGMRWVEYTRSTIEGDVVEVCSDCEEKADRYTPEELFTNA